MLSLCKRLPAAVRARYGRGILLHSGRVGAHEDTVRRPPGLPRPERKWATHETPSLPLSTASPSSAQGRSLEVEAAGGARAARAAHLLRDPRTCNSTILDTPWSLRNASALTHVLEKQSSKTQAQGAPLAVYQSPRQSRTEDEVGTRRSPWLLRGRVRRRGICLICRSLTSTNLLKPCNSQLCHGACTSRYILRPSRDRTEAMKSENV